MNENKARFCFHQVKGIHLSTRVKEKKHHGLDYFVIQVITPFYFDLSIH